jgi:hypothetical protein
MSDIYSAYETGLRTLLEALQQRRHPRYAEALVYEQRLRENIQYSRLYGENETRRAGRAEIIGHLNGVSDSVMGVSFNALCNAARQQDASEDQPYRSSEGMPTAAATDLVAAKTPTTVYDLHDPALIVTFYGQRGQMQPLRDHLVARRQLIQENATTFTNQATRTLLLHFDSPGAADTSIIQLALNSTDQVVSAWNSLRKQLAVILDDTLLQWPIWGYSLIYQAMLIQAPSSATLNSTMLLPTVQAILPPVQPVTPATAETLPLLASSLMSGGYVSLHRIPLEHDGLNAATIYVALSLPDPTNQLVRQVLLGPGATLLMPDLIAHKGYHQIRQYRSDGWLDEYNAVIQSVRSATSQVLNPDGSDRSDTVPTTTLRETGDTLLSKLQDLKTLRISIAQQQENYLWWIEQNPGDTALFQFHQHHLNIARRELELLIEKGEIALDGARTTLERIGQTPRHDDENSPKPDDGSSQIDPLTVTLQFATTKKTTRITWQSAAIGTMSSIFTAPYKGADLVLVIRALDAAQYPGHPFRGPTFTPEERTRLEALGLWEPQRVAREAPRIVGQKLYAALRRSRTGSEALKVVRETARAQGRAINYILRFPSDAVELAALPWELLWDKRQAVLLSRGGREIDSCERYLDLDMALSPPLPAGKKLHVLALAPQADIPQEVRDAERDAQIKSWGALQSQGLLEWDELAPVTPLSLDQWIRQNRVPDIVHYYGHGIYKNDQGYLLFDADDPSGQEQSELVSAPRLAAILGGIRLIVMFACQSAMVAPAEPTSGLLTGVAPALSAVSEVVVAMQLTTRMRAATHFSAVFYEELARGRSIQAAVADARRSLYVIESDGMSWYVPTLYIRTREQESVYLIRNQ